MSGTFRVNLRSDISTDLKVSCKTIKIDSYQYANEGNSEADYKRINNDNCHTFTATGWKQSIFHSHSRNERDNYYEPNEQFTLEIKGVGTTVTKTITIIDNDTEPTLTITPSKNPITEGETLKLTFTLSGGSELDYPISYNYFVQDDRTATVATGLGGPTTLDVTPITKTITINKGDKKATADIFKIVDDSIDEPDEKLDFTINEVGNYAIGIPTGEDEFIITIKDKNMAGTLIPVYLAGKTGTDSILKTQLSIDEVGGKATVEAMLPVAVTAAMLADPADQGIKIPITAMPISKTGANMGDFMLSNQIITIEIGEKSGFTTLMTVDDNDNDKSRYKALLIELGTMPSGFEKGDRSKLAVVINDDDAIGVSLRNLSTGTISEENNGEATFEVHLDRPLATEQELGLEFQGMVFKEGQGSQAVLKYSPKASKGARKKEDFMTSSDTVNFVKCTKDQTCTVTVTAMDDKYHEGTEGVDISIVESDPTDPTLGNTTLEGRNDLIKIKENNSLSLSITDNDAAPAITLTVDADKDTDNVQTSLAENGGVKTVRVIATLDGTTRLEEAASLTLVVGKEGDSAVEGTDYTEVTSESIRIDKDAKSGYVDFSLTPTDDDLYEGSETISLDGTLMGATVTGTSLTLTDDDAQPSFAVADASAAEGDAITFTVTRSGAMDNVVSVKWNTKAANGAGAASTSDYTAMTTPTKLDFAKGEDTQTFTVATTEDNLHEGDETFLVELTGAVGATIATAEATGTITDDDAAPSGITLSVDTNGSTSGTPSTVAEDAGGTVVTVTATVNGETRYVDAKTVAVSVTDGTAASPGDYAAVNNLNITIAAGAASHAGSFTVTPVDDDLDESNETINVTGTLTDVTITAATVTLTDTDAPVSFSIADAEATEGGKVTFTVSRKGARDNVASVKVATATDSGEDANAADADDYTAIAAAQTLSFAAGVTSQTVEVQTTQDDLFEPDETFKAVLSDPALADGDPGTGVSIEMGKGTATGTIKNDDAKPSFAVADASASEGDAITFTVTRSGAMDNAVSVKWNTKADSGAGAASSSDYTEATTAAKLDFAKGVSMQTFSVATTEDTLHEGNETFLVELTGAVGATIATAEATGTINDDDAAPSGITLSVDTNGSTSGTPSTVAEDAGGTVVTVTATVNGTTRYVDAKTVEVSVTDGTAASPGDYAAVNNLNITIAAGAASHTGSFTVTPVDDDLDESNETINVTGTLTDVTITAATVTLTDTDAPVSFSIADAEATEGGKVTFTVSRKGAGDNVASVKVATATDSGEDANAADTDDYTAIATARTLNFAKGITSQTVEVQTTQDDLFEPDETFKAVLSDPALADGDPGTGVSIEMGKGTATGTIKKPSTPTTIPRTSRAPLRRMVARRLSRSQPRLEAQPSLT